MPVSIRPLMKQNGLNAKRLSSRRPRSAHTSLKLIIDKIDPRLKRPLILDYFSDFSFTSKLIFRLFIRAQA